MPRGSKKNKKRKKNQEMKRVVKKMRIFMKIGNFSKKSRVESLNDFRIEMFYKNV